MITLYIIIGLIWAIWALIQQVKLFGRNWRVPVAVILNFAFWPACMIMAIGNSKEFDRFKKTFYTMPPGFKLQKLNCHYRWHDGFIQSTVYECKWLTYRSAWEQYWYRQDHKDTEWHDVDN